MQIEQHIEADFRLLCSILKSISNNTTAKLQIFYKMILHVYKLERYFK